MNLRTVVQGKSPFLGRRPPLHDPLPADSPDAWESSEIRLHSLTVSVQFFSAYRQVWRAKEYFAKFDAAYADVIPSPGKQSA